MMRRASLIVFAAALLLPSVNGLHAQQGRGGAAAPAEPPPTARAAAPFDPTGYWVSVITEDWRWRMVPPPKGDYAGLQLLNPAARKVADAWDPARDEAAGEQCRAYGAAGVMRKPGRLRISWQGDNTLKVETDAGTQTRLLYFAPEKPPNGPASWQGASVGTWEPRPRGGGGGARGAGAGAADGARGAAAAPAPPRFGNMKVVTTRMRSGYLRTNGVPYSADATLTEYWDSYARPNGDQWLVVTSGVDDPTYLTQQFLQNSNFKKEPDGSKWDPTPCSARW